MKKAFIFSVSSLSLALTLSVLPTGAQAAFLNFKATDKATVTTPAASSSVKVQSTTTATTPAPSTVSTDTTADDSLTTDDDLTMTDLQNQPLPIRRQIVTKQLGDILMKLNVLSDKTKAAADRLAQNGVVTDAAQTDLSNATLTLAQAKLSIDSLTAAANNVQINGLVNLKVDGIAFKDAVIKTEDLLRTGRQSIIDSLDALKASVNAAATVTAQ